MQGALVLGCKHGKSAKDDTYFLLVEHGSGVRLMQCNADSILEIGGCFEVEIKGANSIHVGKPLGKARKNKILNLALGIVKESVMKRKPYGEKDLDSMTALMEKPLDEYVSLFLKKILLSAPIIIRFHNDADGSSGAYGLYIAIEELLEKSYFDYKPKIFWKMHRSVSYTEMDAMEDSLTVNNHESTERPLLMLIDFGTSTDSNEGINIAQNKFDIIWLDHHPVEKGFNYGKANYLNPWLFGGDSNYTAGFLACEFSKKFSSADFSCMQGASLCGDYSIYCKHDKCGSELADILDLLTSYKKVAISSFDDNLTPAEIESILKDPVKKKELLSYIHSHMSDFLDSAVSSVKVYNGAVKVFLLDFGKLRDEVDSGTKYPLPGRFASKLMERISSLNKGACILILHFGRYISLRASSSAGETVDMLAIARSIKESYKGVEAAGGHSKALSIKLSDEDEKKNIIRALLKSFGVKA